MDRNLEIGMEVDFIKQVSQSVDNLLSNAPNYTLVLI